MTDALQAQYEAFPYPARDPRDETRRLITGSPSHLDELNHYVFAGRLDRKAPFRVLVAGGGTGDGLVMVAQQCADAGIPADLTYLDLSAASARIAAARVKTRGLTGVRFLQGSLLDLDRLAPGPYDYIDCCGVLHHLDDPAAGLGALARHLAPTGGMGLMVYAPYGRTGVYPLQDALRRLTGGLPLTKRVELTRRLLHTLPATNWFGRNPHLKDHRDSTAGLVDLLLHSRDRPYTVVELADLVAGAGLAITGLVHPLRYDPASYLTDPKLLARLGHLDPIGRAALAEALAGNITTHAVYVVPAARRAEAVAQPDEAGTAIPVLRDLDGPDLARRLTPGQGITAEFGAVSIKLRLPPLAGPILGRIDGHRTMADVHADLAGGGPPWATFRRQFDQLYAALNGNGNLYLRF
ncbi:MAG: class I SAM-dependent methyltransferase [Inquilinaceae bacterium]